MMKKYRTSEVANCVKIHPNTVRLYEKLGLIPKPEREPNGYRIFTDFHLKQFLGAFLLIILSIFSIGLMVGGVAPNMKMASVLASIIYFPMLIFSGATLLYELMILVNNYKCFLSIMLL